jgi:hypothetical protein
MSTPGTPLLVIYSFNELDRNYLVEPDGGLPARDRIKKQAVELPDDILQESKLQQEAVAATRGTGRGKARILPFDELHIGAPQLKCAKTASVV